MYQINSTSLICRFSNRLQFVEVIFLLGKRKQYRFKVFGRITIIERNSN